MTIYEEQKNIRAAKDLLESKGYDVVYHEPDYVRSKRSDVVYNLTEYVKLRNIIDTWNMLEKYGIENKSGDDRYILISKADYNKMLDGAKNKRYIMNLRASKANESGNNNPYVHRNEKEKCYDCGRDGWSYDEKDDEDLDEADVTLSKEDRMNPSKLDFKSIAKRASDKEKAEQEAQANAKRAEQEAQAKAKQREELRAKYADVIDNIKSSSDPIETAFSELVPASGKADTVAGELVRAMMRLLYRDYNDGDKFYEGYGLETCASSAAYIIGKVDGTYEAFRNLAETIPNMGENEGDKKYTEGLSSIAETVVDFIVDNPETFATPNEEDSRSTDIDEIEEWEPEYNLEMSLPDNLYYHIDNDDISTSDLEREMQDWDGLSDANISVNTYGVYIEGLSKEWYEELNYNLYRWLIQYGEDLDDEYGSADERDEQEYEEDEED